MGKFGCIFWTGYVSIFTLQSVINFASTQIVDNSNFVKPELKYIAFEDEDGLDGGISVISGDNVNNRVSVISQNKTEVEFGCTATYPIQWDITGYIQPPEFVKIQPYRRKLINETTTIFSLKLFIFFTPDESETEVASSALVSCTSVDNPSKQSSIAVFVPGSKPLVNSGETIRLQDTSVIPCATTDPRVPVNIFRKSNNGRMNFVSRVNLNYTYDPIQGFTFSNLVEGEFTCATLPADAVNYEVKITKTAIEGFDYYPKSKSVKAFTNDAILLNCSSNNNSKKVNIQSYSKNITLTLVTNTGSTKAVEVTSSMDSTSGIIRCIDDNQQIISTWEYLFIDPPELYLDNFEGEVDCLSNNKNKSVSTVRCQNPSDCRFMKHCFRNASLCNFKRQKQFHSEKRVRCWIEEKGRGAACASIPYSHLNGLVQCTVDGLKRYWEFFVSLDFLRHYNWENVPQTELIRMDEVDEILYTNNTAIFFCTATAYLFADSITFSIEYENGTTEFLNESLYTNPGKEDRRKIDEFNVLGELKINLTLETVAITCHAPWWNSTDYMTVQRQFVTKHLLKPIIQPTQNREIFVIGENNRKLICLGAGEPKPNYVWYKDGKVIDDNSNLKINTGSKGESILEFPFVKESEKGTYLCEANNSVGTANFEFFVDTEQEAVSTKTVVYGTTVGIILMILAVVVCILGAVVHQYRKARALLRGLTENEIDEFFKGKPEFIDSYQRLTVDTLDLLPYDSGYEIDLEDIDFDSSNVLGSGEFSYVVRGSIKSMHQDVAVKIAKSSADVTLFKSLLSEVKIMIFIGKHENIVALVGASTRNIRNRNIHIVMELCETGSLENYLRKNRKDFSNLIDQNQKINTALMKEDAKVSTLDLIRYSEQICKGMEYLAFKSIVHADLAARNVLLNNAGIAKISDFGLSKKLYECNNYVKKTKSPLPWRWMALESLTTLSFSSDSDIWSLGVTLWEIFTLGDVPFPNESWNKDFINRLASGMRMGRPKFSTPEIYSKIVACWDDDATLRPAFSNLRMFFNDLFVSLQPREYDQVANDIINEPSSQLVIKEVKVEVKSQEAIRVNEDDKAVWVGRLYANEDSEHVGEPNYANFDTTIITGGPNYANLS